MHFWSGWYCLVDGEDAKEVPPSVAISDTIKIVSDLENKIPDRSWMLYLLELFNKQQIPVELNLICSFNDDGKFHAIFDGVNRYEFKLKPIIGHSYLRQINLEPLKQRIGFLLMDEISGQTDAFFFGVNANFDFSMSKHFTGVEWHNNISNMAFPIRYEVEISNLAYGVHDNPSDLQSIAYFPYNQLLQDNDVSSGKDYPISFHDFETKKGFIMYKIGNGNSHMGIMDKFFKPNL